MFKILNKITYYNIFHFTSEKLRKIVLYRYTTPKDDFFFIYD